MKKHIDLPTGTNHLQEIVNYQAGYIAFLEKEFSEVAGFLYIHNWKYSEVSVKKGEDFRDKIKRLLGATDEKSPIPSSSEPTTKTFAISSSEKPKVEYRNPENLSPEVIGRLKKGYRLIREDEDPMDTKFYGRRALHYRAWIYDEPGDIIMLFGCYDGTYATDLPEPMEENPFDFSQGIHLIKKYHEREAFTCLLSFLENLNDRVAALEKEGK